MAHPATELRNSLNVAAKAAFLDGATARQIDTLIALAKGANKFDGFSDAHLTKKTASHIIDTMMAEGVQPDWDITDEEIDDNHQARQDGDAAAAARKVQKDQKAAEKEARDTAALAAVAKAADGRKVRHAKLGLGDVVAEDETTVTAIFVGQKKPTKIMKSFVEVQ
jgi:hypothetical protein